MIRSLTSIAILTENIVLAQRPGLTGGSGSRGSLLEQLRYYARDAEGLAGRALSPIEMGRCANREFGSQCCAGSNWNCQAPGSKCSCDQMCREFNDCCPDYEDLCLEAEERLVSCDLRNGDINNNPPMAFEPAKIPDDAKLARASGDPHYHTYDGRTIHYQGGCTYKLSGLCSYAATSVEGNILSEFNIYAKNRQSFRNSARNEPRPMAWVETMIVEMPVKTGDVEIGSKFVTVGQDLAIQLASVWTNGTSEIRSLDEAELPFDINDDAGDRVGHIYKKGNYVRVQVGIDGLTAGFNGKQNMKINLPCQYMGNVCGLMGNADADPSNDDRMPSDISAEDDNILGESWVATNLPVIIGDGINECSDSLPEGAPRAPEVCDANNLREAATHCTAILDAEGPFGGCLVHDVAGSFFEDCVYDLCLYFENDLDIEQAKCDVLEAYANECRDMGTTNIFWREELECPVQCGKNERFFDETDTEMSCDGPVDISVDNHVVEGCFCKDGYVRNGEKCQREDRCPTNNQDSNIWNDQFPNMPGMKLDGDIEEFNPIEFLDDLSCLTENPIEKERPVSGGNGHHARNDWVAPDACCDDKPYNTGVKSCCGGLHVYDPIEKFCIDGQVVHL
ncbi:Oidioi.mRNA.OKI2018_I69.chr1.g547.t1.cds [Oikopleura dioica]|uniref:Oidioi.mRNA.OKI2018_I69.chr1.g547.t1.cds n=1 Tax=Oikopleura dioica TaxID=34765 RepID=A0ABN7SNV9_OIKDI|nr:Oidioi.mRNA.OKI2018_I69.chr1.g547.t1.cds [Oikopleura dioica]